jgi:hypothetical protein
MNETTIRTLFFRGLLFLPVVLFASLFWACQDFNSFDGSDPNPYVPLPPSELGMPLIAREPAGIVSLIWSNDSAEIYFSTGTALKAVDVRTSIVRVLATGQSVYYERIQKISRTGTKLFVAGYENGASVLYSVDVQTGTAQALIRNSTGVISPFDTLIAFSANPYPYQSQDSLYLYSTTTGRVSSATVGVPRVFSPDGNRILIIRYDPQTYATTYRLLTLNPFGVQPYSWSLPYDEYILQLRWDLAGIRVLTSRYAYPMPEIHLRNMSTDESSLIFSDSSANLLDWSADGMKIAVSRLGTQSQPWATFGVTEERLYSIDATTLTASPLARLYVRSYYGTSNISSAFSPNGASIALVFRSQIFLTGVP